LRLGKAKREKEKKKKKGLCSLQLAALRPLLSANVSTDVKDSVKRKRYMSSKSGAVHLHRYPIDSPPDEASKTCQANTKCDLFAYEIQDYG
jgi:hypothetical protein